MHPNVIGKRGGRFLAGLLVVWLTALPAFAQSCQVPGPLLSLARSLAAVSNSTQPVTPAQASRIASQMDRLSERRMLRDLEEAGLQSLAGLALDLMAEGERLSSSGTGFDARRLNDMLSEFDTQATISCDSIEEGIFQKIQQERLGGIFTEKGVKWQEVEKAIEEEKVASLALLFSAVAIVIGTLYLIDSTIRWVMALVYNRKVCRIPADLKVRGHRIEGLVVTLGRGGFRFHALDHVAFDAALDTLSAVPAEVHIEDADPLSCTLSRTHEVEADFRLETPIRIRKQRALLLMSTISPFYVPRSRDGGEEVTKSVV